MQERRIVREAQIEESTRRPPFEDLYRAHVGEARRVAFLSVGDVAHAEDIVQEAFVRVLGRFGDIRKPAAFKTYLLRTVLSLSKNHFRRRSLERDHPHMPPAPVGAPIEPDDELLDALRKLPYRQRAAVVLRYCQDLSENETAQILRTSTKAVQSLVRRGLATLKKEVER
jgi:DNA-directed RNA polymerase specialized sigma24 family protein